MSKGQRNTRYEYLCPHCGNEAPFVLKSNNPWRCQYCKQTFRKFERIKVKC